ncbi:unnamed protein product [Linum trigynum]|uniref:Uncharacterized protein n=1 Tax=Linum trigynum TaxID=586398 RepID=A0AAV2DLV5_9ROSI
MKGPKVNEHTLLRKRLFTWVRKAESKAEVKQPCLLLGAGQASNCKQRSRDQVQDAQMTSPASKRPRQSDMAIDSQADSGAMVVATSQNWAQSPK